MYSKVNYLLKEALLDKFSFASSFFPWAINHLDDSGTIKYKATKSNIGVYETNWSEYLWSRKKHVPIKSWTTYTKPQ